MAYKISARVGSLGTGGTTTFTATAVSFFTAGLTATFGFTAPAGFAVTGFLAGDCAVAVTDDTAKSKNSVIVFIIVYKLVRNRFEVSMIQGIQIYLVFF